MARPTGITQGVGPTQAQILQALRAGRIGTAEADARWSGSWNVLSRMAARGWVRRIGGWCESGYWEITPAGLAVCPFRNPVLVLKLGREAGGRHG